MPLAFVKDEEKWKKAKEAAAAEGRAKDYGYIMCIYKKMTGQAMKKAIDMVVVPAINNSLHKANRREGLTKKMITVTRGGSTYQTSVWVKIGEDLRNTQSIRSQVEKIRDFLKNGTSDLYYRYVQKHRSDMDNSYESGHPLEEWIASLRFRHERNEEEKQERYENYDVKEFDEQEAIEEELEKHNLPYTYDAKERALIAYGVNANMVGDLSDFDKNDFSTAPSGAPDLDYIVFFTGEDKGSNFAGDGTVVRPEKVIQVVKTADLKNFKKNISNDSPLLKSENQSHTIQSDFHAVRLPRGQTGVILSTGDKVRIVIVNPKELAKAEMLDTFEAVKLPDGRPAVVLETGDCVKVLVLNVNGTPTVEVHDESLAFDRISNSEVPTDLAWYFRALKALSRPGDRSPIVILGDEPTPAEYRGIMSHDIRLMAAYFKRVWFPRGAPEASRAAPILLIMKKIEDGSLKVTAEDLPALVAGVMAGHTSETGQNHVIKEVSSTIPNIAAEKPDKQYMQFQGLRICIENPAGSIRSGQDADGNVWQTSMDYPYGYIEGTKGDDGEELDAFIGPNQNADTAFVISIKNPENGKYDEKKVFLGFDAQEDALQAFHDHYDMPDFIQGIEAMPVVNLLQKAAVAKALKSNVIRLTKYTILNKAERGGKYISRKPKAGGGYIYQYAEAKGRKKKGPEATSEAFSSAEPEIGKHGGQGKKPDQSPEKPQKKPEGTRKVKLSPEKRSAIKSTLKNAFHGIIDYLTQAFQGKEEHSAATGAAEKTGEDIKAKGEEMKRRAKAKKENKDQPT